MAVFRFHDFEADDLKFELRRLGEPVHVQRIVLETLFCLLRRQGCVVSRKELVQGPWRGVKVSAAAVNRAVMLARRAIRDERGSTIVTVHGLGYRFAAPIAGSADEQVASSGRYATIAVDASATEEEPPSARFSGRHAELAALHRHVEKARASHGRVVLVSGDVGIGKTALVTRLAIELKHKGPLVVWGRAWGASAAPALWPWLEIVRSVLHGLEQAGEGELPPAHREERARLLGSLEHVVAAGSAERVSGEQFFVFDAVARFLKQSTRSRALVAILEDLQQADLASIMLLEFLRQRIGELPLLVIATRRFGHVSQPKSSFEETGAHVHRLSLPGLDPRAVAHLLAALGHAHAEQLAVAVRELTGGNPLLVRELAASPVLSGLEAGSERWLEQYLLPERIAQVVREQLLGLPAETLRALAAAAVSGTRFHGAMIGELSARGEGRAGPAPLEPALARQLIQADSDHPGQYRLTSLLLREVIGRDLSQTERNQLQRRVSDWRERAAQLAMSENVTNKRQSSPWSALPPIEARGS
jgi:DNA-binding winged helix-turn-helix (wHTH) protein